MQPFPDEIHSLPATITTRHGTQTIDYDGGWLRSFVQAKLESDVG
jgi:hypothetical protein